MTDDLPTRLRTGCHSKCIQNYTDRFYHGYVCPPCNERLEAADRIDEAHEAADEIDRLEERIEELEAENERLHNRWLKTLRMTDQ